MDVERLRPAVMSVTLRWTAPSRSMPIPIRYDAPMEFGPDAVQVAAFVVPRLADVKTPVVTTLDSIHVNNRDFC